MSDWHYHTYKEGVCNCGDRKGTHDKHCYQGEYEDSCKYGDPYCPTGMQEDLFEHEKLILEAGLWEDRDAILGITNGLITAGIKLGQSLEWRSIDMDEYDKKWDLIDKRKLPYVKRLISLLKEGKE